MLFDQQNILSDQQDLAQAIGSYLSTNSIDLGASATDTLGNTIESDPGKSGAKLRVQVTETFTSAGAATLKVDVVSGTGVDANGQINAGKKVHNSSRAYALAHLVAGKIIEVALVPGIDQRYLAVEYTIGTAATTAGAVTAGIVKDGSTIL